MQGDDQGLPRCQRLAKISDGNHHIADGLNHVLVKLAVVFLRFDVIFHYLALKECIGNGLSHPHGLREWDTAVQAK